MNLKLELRFRDRVGIVADISAIIARQGLNIVCVEHLALHKPFSRRGCRNPLRV